jgi:general nucleoside transport system permease protein
MITALLLGALTRSLDGLVSGTITATAPILLAALGGMYTYYAGIFNIAMEGMILAGAYGAVVGAFYGGHWTMGVVGGIGGSTLLALLYLGFVVGLGVDEFVTGIALNLAAVGITTFLLRRMFNVAGAFSGTATKPIARVPKLPLGFLRRIPVLRALLSGQSILVWLCVSAVVMSSAVVFRTRYGLHLRAAGYNAPSLDASGVSTKKTRTIAVLVCGLLCGLAGAFLSTDYTVGFGEGMSAGRGWIALAAIVLVAGRPYGVAVICLLFGLAGSVGLKLQGLHIAPQFTEMLRYIATLIALYVYSRRRRRIGKRNVQRNVQRNVPVAAT